MQGRTGEQGEKRENQTALPEKTPGERGIRRPANGRSALIVSGKPGARERTEKVSTPAREKKESHLSETMGEDIWAISRKQWKPLPCGSLTGGEPAIRKKKNLKGKNPSL